MAGVHLLACLLDCHCIEFGTGRIPISHDDLRQDREGGTTEMRVPDLRECTRERECRPVAFRRCHAHADILDFHRKSPVFCAEHVSARIGTNVDNAQ